MNGGGLYWMYMGPTAGGDQCHPVTLQSLGGQPLVSAQPAVSSTPLGVSTADPFSTNHLQLLSQQKLFNPLAALNAADFKAFNWAYLPAYPDKPDTSKHFHMFVGDLCPNLDLHQLQEAFAPFGPISDCKIIQDPLTLKSKGYGFVTFVKKDDAESAIKHMNGQFIGSRQVRTNWAIRKGSSHLDGGRAFSYEDILNQPGAANCTVYCGGIMTNLTEEAVRKTFIQFGEITEIRIFKEKGYAFIRYTCKEDAARAIIETHLTEVAGHVVKCSWGKKSEENPPMVPQPLFPPLIYTQLLQQHQGLKPPPAPAGLTFLSAQPQQCYPAALPSAYHPTQAGLGPPLGPPAGLGAPPTPFNPLEYYVCPPPDPSATAAAAYQRSLECVYTQQLLQQQHYSQLPALQTLLPSVGALQTQQQQQQQQQLSLGAFPPSALMYTVQ